METLVTALGPVFAAGLAIQQLLELLDSILLKKLVPEDNKKAILGALSLAGGLALAFGAGLRVLAPLGVTSPWYWDELTTGLIISGGTQGVNSILKFLSYAKEGKKADAVAKLTPVKNHLKPFADSV
jgi:hypothetical protein